MVSYGTRVGFLEFDLGTLDPLTNTLITIDVLVTSTVPSVITNVATFVTTNTNVAVSAGMDTAIVSMTMGR